jgi:hypothetical protein
LARFDHTVRLEEPTVAGLERLARDSRRGVRRQRSETPGRRRAALELANSDRTIRAQARLRLRRAH